MWLIDQLDVKQDKKYEHKYIILTLHPVSMQFRAVYIIAMHRKDENICL